VGTARVEMDAFRLCLCHDTVDMEVHDAGFLLRIRRLQAGMLRAHSNFRLKAGQPEQGFIDLIVGRVIC